MDDDKPRRAWFRCKRVWAVIASWLLTPPLYFGVVGLLWYCDGRGWTPNRLSWAVTKPIDPLAEAVGLKEQWVRYTSRSASLGMKHSRAAPD